MLNPNYFQKFGRIYAFVDFGNVNRWQERMKWKIDFKKLGNFLSFTKKKFFYYGIDPQISSSIFLVRKAKRSGFIVETKEVKEITDEVGIFRKCNFDVEITMDVLLRMQDYDTVMLFSGDSDFGKLMKYVRTHQKKVIIVCVDGFLSKELYQNNDRLIWIKWLKDQIIFK